MPGEASTRTIAFYGKGGIGKTTVASNISALFARRGDRVLQIGCDPKHDSCHKLVDRRAVRTVMDMLMLRRGAPLTKDDIIMQGRCGVHCIETGGPEPGVGCAGRGITKMFETLRDTDVLSGAYDTVIFDVLGDIVCGGFAAPLRSGMAKEVYIVLSGEIMAMYAANNLCRAVERYARNGVSLGGLVANLRGVPNELSLLERFADAVGTRLLHPIPRSETVQRAELASRTVIEFAPDSDAARRYEALFEQISRDSAGRAAPRPMDDSAFEDFIAAKTGHD